MNRRTAGLLALMAAMVSAVDANAGVPLRQYDVSIAVTVTPSTFQPGDRGTVALTLHNAGPDPAGTSGSGANYVIGPGFRLASAGDWGPFDIIWNTVNGCNATYDVIGPGLPPTFYFGLTFQFYFAVVPPDSSLTCTFDIVFLPTPFQTFESRWRYVQDVPGADPNPANDQVFYTFVAGTPHTAPTRVPATSWLGHAVAALGLGWLAIRKRRSIGRGLKRPPTIAATRNMGCQIDRQ